MGLDVLLQILRTLEGLSAEITFVWFEGDMDSDVGGDMIPLDGGGTARVPSTGEVQIVGAFSSDMLLADVVLEKSKLLVIRQGAGSKDDIQRETQQTCIFPCTCPIGMRGCHRH